MIEGKMRRNIKRLTTKLFPKAPPPSPSPETNGCGNTVICRCTNEGHCGRCQYK